MSRVLTILSFLLITSFCAQAQTRNNSIPSTDKIVKTYPNPAISIINFEIQNSIEKGLEMQVFNFLGKKVYENKNLTQRTILNLTDFIRGVYIYRLRDNTGNIIESGKFQVSK